MAERFDLLDMDDTRKPTPAAPESATRPLDMLDNIKCPTCSKCGEPTAVNEDGMCQKCHQTQTQSAVEHVQARTPDSFADIVANAAANAAAPMLGDMARGRASLGVGFTSAAGYIEALRRGAARATVTSYASTLRRTYKMSVDVSFSGNRYTVSINEGKSDHMTFDAALLQLEAGSGESGVDSHANDEGIAKLRRESAARKAAQAKVKADVDAQTPLSSAPVVVDDERVVLRHGELVAGGAAEGHGVVFGWTGKGPLTHAELTSYAVSLGLPPEAMPKPKEAATQARRAVQSFQSGELTFYTEERGRKWRLERPRANAKAGETSGDVALVCTLVGESTLECEGDATLSIQVRAEFDKLIATQLHQATDVSKWLVDDVLRGQLSAVKYGVGWYVARRHRALAERVIATFDGKWGADWMNPALPVATCAQLAQGLANGLAAEIDEIIEKVKEARHNAMSKRGVDIGETKASNEMAKLHRAGERVVAYAQLLGDKLVADCREKLRKAMIELDEVAGTGIEQRFAQVWSEIEFDIKRSGGEL